MKRKDQMLQIKKENKKLDSPSSLSLGRFRHFIIGFGNYEAETVPTKRWKRRS
jgi:hypothetical protein